MFILKQIMSFCWMLLVLASKMVSLAVVLGYSVNYFPRFPPPPPGFRILSCMLFEACSINPSKPFMGVVRSSTGCSRSSQRSWGPDVMAGLKASHVTLLEQCTPRASKRGET